MKFEPKTEEQIQAESLVPAGTYEVEVVDCTDHVSKSGNAMLKLKIKAYTSDGSRTLYDYLAGGKMQYKLLHFCDASGLRDKYDRGELEPQDCIGVNVSADIGIQPAKGEYQASNRIEDYKAIAKSGSPAPTQKRSMADGPMTIQEDEIPFDFRPMF